MRHRKSEFDSRASPTLWAFFTLAFQRETGGDALSLRVAYEREETLGIRCGPDRRRAHDSRGGRKFAFDWQAAADLDTLACS